MQLNEIIDWVDGAFGEGFASVDISDVGALQQLFEGEGYQRYLQDQVNRQIIRDYLANAVLLGVLSESGLPAFATQLSTEEGRSSLALHMLMCSVDDALDLLPADDEIDVLTPLVPRSEGRPHIKLVPN
ncbi:MAG: hypothetical protein AB8C02_17845 [Halioglobus sp.]